MSVVENIQETCDGMGDIELSGIRLESADRRLLDLRTMTLDEHVALQPSAVAYFGALLKEAEREFERLKRHNKRWLKKKMAEARVSVTNGTKSAASILKGDIEARFIIDNEPEIEKRDEQEDKLQQQVDTLSNWFDAWKQKSFSMRPFTDITEEERFNSKSSIQGSESKGFKKTDRQGKMDMVRAIQRKRKEKQG